MPLKLKHERTNCKPEAAKKGARANDRKIAKRHYSITEYMQNGPHNELIL